MTNQTDSFSDYADQYGVVEYDGKTYALTSEADYTNRLLPGGYTNYYAAGEGDEYDFEMGAYAVDVDYNQYYVTWIFTGTKGESDPDLDTYDYSVAERVES
jgi:hypothetical protein